MTAYATEFAALTLCLLAAGCGAPQAKLNVAKGEDVPAEFARLQDLLSPPEAAGSDEAFYTLEAIISDECRGDEALFHAKMLNRFNGKSVQDVIDEYHQLDPAIVTKHAKTVSEKRAKASDEAWEHVNKRLNEDVQTMRQEQIDSLEKHAGKK